MKVAYENIDSAVLRLRVYACGQDSEAMVLKSLGLGSSKNKPNFYIIKRVDFCSDLKNTNGLNTNHRRIVWTKKE